MPRLLVVLSAIAATLCFTLPVSAQVGGHGSNDNMPLVDSHGRESDHAEGIFNTNWNLLESSRIVAQIEISHQAACLCENLRLSAWGRVRAEREILQSLSNGGYNPRNFSGTEVADMLPGEFVNPSGGEIHESLYYAGTQSSILRDSRIAAIVRREAQTILAGHTVSNPESFCAFMESIDSSRTGGLIDHMLVGSSR